MACAEAHFQTKRVRAEVTTGPSWRALKQHDSAARVRAMSRVRAHVRDDALSDLPLGSNIALALYVRTADTFSTQTA
ncbi:protein of unknown function [Pararobbsia alpina]